VSNFFVEITQPLPSSWETVQNLYHQPIHSMYIVHLHRCQKTAPGLQFSEHIQPYNTKDCADCFVIHAAPQRASRLRSAPTVIYTIQNDAAVRGETEFILRSTLLLCIPHCADEDTVRDVIGAAACTDFFLPSRTYGWTRIVPLQHTYDLTSDR
jgi:hypothetical protein